MKLIVCIDARGGMLFNHRRVSSDRTVTERILQLVGDSRLLVNSYTYQLFTPKKNIICTNDPQSAAREEDWCFVEDRDVSGALAAAQTVVVFCWNRTYPADLYFPLKDLYSRLPLTSSEEFQGNSHQCITMEVYSR